MEALHAQVVQRLALPPVVSSNWGSNFHLVNKKKIQHMANVHRLQGTERQNKECRSLDMLPPRVDDRLDDALSGAKFFCALDFISVYYHQLELTTRGENN